MRIIGCTCRVSQSPLLLLLHLLLLVFLLLLCLLPAWHQMGTAKESFIELTERIGRKTGGLSVYPFSSAKRGADTPVSYIMVRLFWRGGCKGLSILTIRLEGVSAAHICIAVWN